MNKKRLLKLAAFLRTLKPKQFDFGEWVSEARFEEKQATKCGTTCCAIGWCPSVFPRSWRWNVGRWGRLLPELKDASIGTASQDGQAFFGIDAGEFDYLFVPGDLTIDAGLSLGFGATAKQVARRIERFVISNGETMRRAYKKYYGYTYA